MGGKRPLVELGGSLVEGAVALGKALLPFILLIAFALFGSALFLLLMHFSFHALPPALLPYPSHLPLLLEAPGSGADRGSGGLWGLWECVLLEGLLPHGYHILLHG